MDMIKVYANDECLRIDDNKKLWNTITNHLETTTCEDDRKLSLKIFCDKLRSAYNIKELILLEHSDELNSTIIITFPLLAETFKNNYKTGYDENGYYVLVPEENLK